MGTWDATREANFTTGRLFEFLDEELERPFMQYPVGIRHSLQAPLFLDLSPEMWYSTEGWAQWVAAAPERRAKRMAARRSGPQVARQQVAEQPQHPISSRGAVAVPSDEDQVEFFDSFGGGDEGTPVVEKVDEAATEQGTAAAEQVLDSCGETTSFDDDGYDDADPDKVKEDAIAIDDGRSTVATSDDEENDGALSGMQNDGEPTFSFSTAFDAAGFAMLNDGPTPTWKPHVSLRSSLLSSRADENEDPNTSTGEAVGWKRRHPVGKGWEEIEGPRARLPLGNQEWDGIHSSLPALVF